MQHLMPLCILGFALLVASNVWIFFRVMRPLRMLARQATDIAEGQLDALERTCGGTAEIEMLRRSMAGMAGHVRRSQQQSRVYAEALTEGQEAERARIARELHDDTVQSLIAIAHSIDLARQFDGERAAAMLQTARSQAIETAGALRNLIANLRPPALEELGLLPAIQMLAAPQVKVQVTGVQRRLPPTHELALFRVVQEALNNARRHGKTDRVKIMLHYQPQAVEVTIRDDGRGFVMPKGGIDTFVSNGHYGLMGSRERVVHLGGDFEIESTAGQGTTLRLHLPSQPVMQHNTVRDPVCSTILQPEEAYAYADYNGERYYFCCPVCRGAFQREPEAYLTPFTDKFV